VIYSAIQKVRTSAIAQAFVLIHNAGELPRFQAGVTMEISRLDAWYSDAEGSLEDPATYIVRGLCRRCCLPELILRCMQVIYFNTTEYIIFGDCKISDACILPILKL